MTASAPPVASGGAGLKTRLAAGAVIVALAALAAFAVFGGPTHVPATGGSHAAPATQAPPRDDGGGEFGD